MKTLFKLLLVLLVFFLVGTNHILAVENVAVEEVSSFEMFWPISPGKVQGDVLYPLKICKEGFREFLILSNFRKADYNIKLAEKRVVEADKLLTVDKKYSESAKTLKAAQAKREKAYEYIKKAEAEGEYVVDLKNTLTTSLEKQQKLLNYLITKLPQEQVIMVKENLSELSATLSKLK
jgi:hypothetical protein